MSSNKPQPKRSQTKRMYVKPCRTFLLQKPLGQIAVPSLGCMSSHHMPFFRTDMIFNNEEALISGLFKIAPKLKKEEGNLEYGYRSKKFPDDPVRVAVKSTGQSTNPIGNWFGSLTSPVNTDNYDAKS